MYVTIAVHTQIRSEDGDSVDQVVVTCTYFNKYKCWV